MENKPFLFYCLLRYSRVQKCVKVMVLLLEAFITFCQTSLLCNKYAVYFLLILVEWLFSSTRNLLISEYLFPSIIRVPWDSEFHAAKS